MKFFSSNRNDTITKNPLINLFVWAILMNRIELAKLFWKLTDVKFILFFCFDAHVFFGTRIKYQVLYSRAFYSKRLQIVYMN
jgi:hypothetical protein